MRYLKKLTRFFINIFRDSDSFDPRLEHYEPLARFITDDRHINKGTRSVKFQCFNPARKTNDLSVYRTKLCPEAEIWSIAERFVTGLRDDKARVLARAEVPLHIVQEQGLILNPDGKPHKRHLNIEGWPLRLQPNEISSHQKMITVQLARAATLKYQDQTPTQSRG